MTTTENGVNAPFIVNCPGLIPEGKTSDALVDFTDMLQTFADFGGAEPETGYIYDGYSMKDVFLGKADKTEREWILAMGSKPGTMTDKGIQNNCWFRDRVIREGRFKLFIGTDRKPEKLVDLSKDLEEENNLIGNPEYAEVLTRLSAVIDTLPEKDNDPKYDTLPANPWDKKASSKADVHKKSNTESSAIKGKKNKKSGKKKKK